MSARKRFPWAKLYVWIGTMVALVLATGFVLKLTLWA
jgi:hypothetical protein